LHLKKAPLEVMQPINQRINQLIEHYQLNYTTFAASIGVKRGTLYNVVGPRASRPSPELLAAIRTAYPEVNSTWLLSGEGKMLGTLPGAGEHPLTYQSNRQPTIKPVGPAITVPEYAHDFAEVKFVDVPAEASYLRGFGDREFIEKLPTLRLPAMGTGSRELYGFTVRGDSMNDRFSNGDIILGQLVERNDALRWGEVYVLLLNDGLVVKELRKGPDEEHLTLHSFNAHFDPYDVLKSEVQAMFRHQASISFNSSNPNRGGIMRFLAALSEQMTNIQNSVNPAKPQ
jgi:phage repressor protein C with HTH and peptisase S24 domain